MDNDTIGQIFTFSLKEGFIVDGTPGFVLQPYDEVYVRRSPGYQACLLYTSRANYYASKGKDDQTWYDKAVADFNQALKVAQKKDDVYYNIGKMCIRDR